MIKALKQFYLRDRFFYGLAVIVLCFITATLAPFLMIVAKGLLLVFVIVLLGDVFILYRQPNNFSASRKCMEVASLNHKHSVVLTITNLNTQALSVMLIDEIPYQLEQRDFKIQLKMKPKGIMNAEYSFIPQSRGSYHFGGINVFGHSTIGFVSRRETFNSPSNLKVVPSVIHMREQELLAFRNLQFNNGENRSRSLGKSYEFDQLKAYIVGDDPRNINWKATSRLREIMVNHYEEERSQQVFCLIDKGRNMKMPFNGLTLVDYAINSTLAFSNIVLKKRDKAGIISFSEKIDTVLAADRTIPQLRKIQLALYNERYHFSESNFELLCISIRRLIPHRSLVFLYTNFETMEALQRNLAALQSINQYHRLVVIFFANTELMKLGQETSKDVMDIYTQAIANKLETEKAMIAKELTKHGIISILTTPENLSADVINKYLQMKAVGLG